MASCRPLNEIVFPFGYSPAKTAGDCYPDEKAAALAVKFIEGYCRHTTGEYAGRPLTLQPWQSDMIRTAFGWFRPDGRRRYNTISQWVARKNGKSTTGAAIALKMLIGDAEPGAQVFSAAGDRPQARIVYGDALKMVHANRSLLRRCKPLLRSITVPSMNAVYEALSADASLKHGLNAHGVIFDELHVQPTRDLWDVLETSMGSRRNPMMWSLSTAGFDQETIGWEVYSYARKVAAGEIDDQSFLPVIYESTSDDDWKDPETWAKANPNLGVSVYPEWISSQVKKAEANPSFENTVRRLYLNQWTQQSERWIPMEWWDKGAKPLVKDDDIADCPCWGGLDLSSTRDTTAFVLLFKLPEGFHVKCWFWLPENAVNHHAGQYGSLFREWSKRGFLTITPGTRIDYDDVRAKINEVGKQHAVSEIAFDPDNAVQLVGKLAKEDGFKMVVCRQGMRTLNDPTKQLDRLIATQSFRHNGNPVLRWMASNAVIKRDINDNIMLDKAKATGRIDGLAATVFALSRALTQTVSDETQVMVF